MAIIWGRTLVCLTHEVLAREKAAAGSADGGDGAKADEDEKEEPLFRPALSDRGNRTEMVYPRNADHILPILPLFAPRRRLCWYPEPESRRLPTFVVPVFEAALLSAAFLSLFS